MNRSMTTLRLWIFTWISVSVTLTSMILGYVVPGDQFDATTQFALCGFGFFAALLLIVWTTPQKTGLESGADSNASRAAAYSYPFSVMRFCFVGALVAAILITVLQSMRSRDLGEAIATGVLTYLITTLPNLLLYLWLRRLLRPMTQGQPGTRTLGGVRQTIRMRMVFVIQLPVVMCGLGMVLVQHLSDTNSVEEIETTFRTMHATVARRAEKELAANVRIQMPQQSVPLVSGLESSSFDSTAFLLVLGILFFSYRTCRAIADDVATDLKAITAALARVEQPAPVDARKTSVGLKECAEIFSDFERAADGFRRQQNQIASAAKKRREAETQKNRFLAHISHELKSPLNSILGFSELLVNEIEGPINETQRKEILEIWHRGDTLLRFILALLDLSKLDGTRKDLAVHSDVAALRIRACSVNAVLSMLKEQYRDDPLGRISVVINTQDATGDPDANRLTIDATQTARALALCMGVLRDCLTGGTVQIKVIDEPDETEIRLTISGPTVDKDALASVRTYWQDDVQSDDGSHFITLPFRLLSVLCPLQDSRVQVSGTSESVSLRFFCATTAAL
ncbi:MAG: histidine kinase dimerization/phospho-acceptor domain-containing protein [Myxococcota bacterium]|nr:histidine kinase dimerization/phospho-acceptor domain-containing protein [Myxococcota bacterium]